MVPPFCVYMYDKINCLPYAPSPGVRVPDNVWGQPPYKVVEIRGEQEAAGFLTR